MKYVNQLDYPYVMYQTNREHPEDTRRDHGTFAMSGCGLSSAIMVADRLLVDYDFDIFDAVDLSYKTNSNHTIGTDYLYYAPAFAEKLGLDVEMTDDPQKVFDCLHTGGAVVALSTGDTDEGHNGLLTHGAHYVAIVSQLRDGRVVVLDPSLTPEKYLEPERVDLVQVDGKMVYTDIKNIVDDYSKAKCENLGFTDSHIFACFWKKID